VCVVRVPLTSIPLHTGADSSSVRTGEWLQQDTYQEVESPSLTLKVHPATNVTVRTTYTVAINVTNPSVGQTSPDMTLVHEGRQYTLQPVMVAKKSGNLFNPDRIVVGSEKPLQIVPAHWIQRKAAQSTMYSGELNTLSITLIASVAIERGTWITIAGLQGAGPFAKDAKQVSVGSHLVAASAHTQTQVGTGNWYGDLKRLTFIVRESLGAGTTINITFQIENPRSMQNAPQIWVHTSQSIGSVRANPGHGCTEDAVLHTRGGGGIGFIGSYSNDDHIVTVSDSGRGFLAQPLVAVKTGGAGCIGNSFTPVMQGTLLAVQSIEADATGMPPGKLGAQPGDSVPLRVDRQRLHAVSIVQDASAPGLVSRITLSFTINFALKAAAQPTLVMSNLTGVTLVADAEGTPARELQGGVQVLLHDDVIPGHRLHFSASASPRHNSSSLLSKEGYLTLHVVQDMLPDVEYRVAFYTRNPVVMRSGREMHVHVVELADILQPLQNMTTSNKTDNCENEQCDASETTSQIHKASPTQALPNLRAVLAIHAAFFYVARISQINPYPSALNNITVAFSTNIRLSATVSLHVTGLVGYTTPSTSNMTVTSLQDIFETEGRWSQESGVLSVRLKKPASELEEYTFSFQLTNPVYGQHYTASSIQLNSSGIAIAAQEMQRETRHVLQNIGMSLPGDRAPPQVRHPVFNLALVSQSTPYAAADNNFTIFLQSNVDLPPQAAITLKGLSNMTGNVSIALRDVDNDQAAALSTKMRFRDSPDQGVPGYASWQMGNDTLRLYLNETLSAMSLVHLTFTLQNPRVGRAPSDLTAESFETGIKPRLMQGDAELLLCGTPNTFRGEALPLSIRIPDFTTRLISQSLTFPGHPANTIFVTLQANAVLSACVITITGLPVSVGNASQVLPLQSAGSSMGSEIFTVEGQGSRARLEQGTILLNIEGMHGMEPFKNYAFKFSLRNPTSAQGPPAIMISACDFIVESQRMMSPDSPIPGLEGSVAGDARVLKIYDKSFILKRVVQSTPWPDAVNTISISITANVDLYSPPSGTMAKVIISGLSGTQTQDAAQLDLSLNAGSPFESKALWRQDTGKLELVVVPAGRLQAGSSSVIAFNVTNPTARLSQTPQVMLEGRLHDGTQIVQTAMDTDMSLVPEVLGATAGDARPLVIYDPAFVVAKIGQVSCSCL
jgi:hypothetical protein